MVSAHTQAKHRAVAKNAKVVLEAGQAGVVLDPKEVRPHTFRTDLVDPVISFAVYGLPAPQGSKSPTMRGGKIAMRESSAGVDPWRKAVRHMGVLAIQKHTERTGRPWKAIDEAVLVTLAITMPPTTKDTREGRVWCQKTPDLDKLQRAVGDALAPVPLKPSEGNEYGESRKKEIRERLMEQRRTVSVLHDDSLIVSWGDPHKVYPATVSDSLGFPGAAIQVYRMRDLDQAAACPTFTGPSGVPVMRAADLVLWARHSSGQPWNAVAADLWQEPEKVLAAQGCVRLRGRTMSTDGARIAARALAIEGPNHPVPVAFEAVTTAGAPPRPTARNGAS